MTRTWTRGPPTAASSSRPSHRRRFRSGASSSARNSTRSPTSASNAVAKPVSPLRRIFDFDSSGASSDGEGAASPVKRTVAREEEDDDDADADELPPTSPPLCQPARELQRAVVAWSPEAAALSPPGGSPMRVVVQRSRREQDAGVADTGDSPTKVVVAVQPTRRSRRLAVVVAQTEAATSRTTQAAHKSSSPRALTTRTRPAKRKSGGASEAVTKAKPSTTRQRSKSRSSQPPRVRPRRTSLPTSKRTTPDNSPAKTSIISLTQSVSFSCSDADERSSVGVAVVSPSADVPSADARASEPRAKRVRRASAGAGSRAVLSEPRVTARQTTKQGKQRASSKGKAAKPARRRKSLPASMDEAKKSKPKPKTKPKAKSTKWMRKLRPAQRAELRLLQQDFANVDDFELTTKPPSTGGTDGRGKRLAWA